MSSTYKVLTRKFELELIHDISLLVFQPTKLTKGKNIECFDKLLMTSEETIVGRVELKHL